ncbi:MAG: alpha-glucosidase family protein [Hyphomonadaceae bacterium]
MSHEWWRGAVLYQIYPRSFLDTNGDGIGDLKGVESKLAYVRSLGVDGIWLSPFFTSPMRDFGYDVSDYRGVDPMFGTLQDFDALVAEAHRRDLKVIIDQVYAHCSSDHPWFQESRQDRTNAKADWFVWADAKPDGSPPNNWQAWFGGPAWTWEPRRRQYFLHNFLPTQPQFNFRNADVRAAMLDTAKFWLERGVDGFRLDVANYYVHDAALRDNPPSGRVDPALPRDMQVHQYNSNQHETLAFLSELRALTDSYGDRMMVAELAPGSQPLMAEYTAGPTRLHTAYAFDFLGEWPGVERFAEIIAAWGEGPDEGWPSWAFCNHDVARVATRWGEAIGAPLDRAAPLFMALLMSLRGTIFIYQGEELGLPEGEVPFDRLQDPWGIAGWPAFKGRDGCRTPMPWDADAPNAGFSSAEPWLPTDARQQALAVSVQEGEKGSMLRRTRSMIELRKDGPALSAGSMKVVHAGDKLLVIERRSKGQRVQMAFNFGDQPLEVDRPMWGYMTLTDGGNAGNSVPGSPRITVAPFGWAYFRGKFP